MSFSVGTPQVHVNIKDLNMLLPKVRASLSERRGFALATVNLDHLVKLRKDQDFARAYAAQDLVTADGNPIVWLSRLEGKPVALIPGSELVLPLMRIASELGVSVAFVGSTPDALEAAATQSMAQIPGLSVALTHSPPFGFDPEGEDARRILQQVNDSGAGLCFVALGAPKQEIFAALGRKIAPDVGFASIGASLDFIAGRQTRAPVWVRKIAMEWLWRALSNPRRLAWRYAQCLALLPRLAAVSLARRFRG